MKKRYPAPPERIYLGWREQGEAGPGIVRFKDGENGRSRVLNPRHDLRNHSPDGFQWGYAGSGPAQLALALVADATGDDELAQRTYQRFKFKVVATLGGAWRMTAADIGSIVGHLAAKADA